jgi:hypothetical protein
MKEGGVEEKREGREKSFCQLRERKRIGNEIFLG